MFCSLPGFAQNVSWAAVQTALRARYPGVPHLSTEALAERLAGSAPPLLLDVRTAEEYGVSHLQGAVHIDPNAHDFDVLRDLPNDAPIVTYCSVGYRSAALAERLEAAGFSAVYNLEGSLFKWANEGRPVYRAGRRVHEVHPYDARWGLLLDKALRAPLY